MNNNLIPKLMNVNFKTFEEQGFLPFILNPGYFGSINPFETLAEQELTTNGSGRL